MARRTFVIVNPKSANGATGRHWPELRGALDRVLESWDSDFTLSRGDAMRLSRRAVAEGYDAIVSVGGDGTNNEVVSGMLDEAGAVVRPELVLGLVRAGTGGDFTRMLGLSSRIPKAVEHLAGAGTRACDIGFIEAVDLGGAPFRRAFLNEASFGLSGVIVDRVNHTTKAFGGGVSFFAGLVRGLTTFRPWKLAIEVDGAPFYEGLVTAGVAANGQYFGGGMRIAKAAAIDDGLLDIVVVTEIGAREIARVAELYTGDLVKWPSVRATRARTLRATAAGGVEPVLLDVDGEQPGRLPATIRVIPNAIRLKV
ncbi:MAG: diacylglycerol kinase family lipid kinase [Deltaproteobacteria bacterium]|nr:diacylglycerol kinase family lipid kinase [Deltaproteobacteria bacterium]